MKWNYTKDRESKVKDFFCKHNYPFATSYKLNILIYFDLHYSHEDHKRKKKKFFNKKKKKDTKFMYKPKKPQNAK